MEVGRFLRLAVALSAALGRLHERGLIHKDIKPANILVDVATDQIKLTGFGIASRLPRERQAPWPPEFIAGTLPYMAPEQTGRMNRSIDSRSDLYSLGMTFYQMLTGCASVHGFRPDGMGPLPHRQNAGAAAASGSGTSRRFLPDRHEARSPRLPRSATRPPPASSMIFDSAAPNGNARPHRSNFRSRSTTCRIGC